MKAALIDRYGGNEVVSVADVDVPTFGATDLLVRVHAASVNPVDVKTRERKLKTLLKYHLPLVLGNDLSGVVLDVGSQVTRFKKGDAVYSRLARHLGATVFTTVGKRNVKLVKRLGASVAIDYRSECFEDVARDCDVVLDSAGGDTLVRCFECVKPGGVVVSINSSTPSPAFARSWRLNPIIVFAIGLLSRKATAAARKHRARYEYFFVQANGEQLREIALLVERGAITPLVDKVFPLDEVRGAFAYSESGRATGKVVIKVV